MNKSITIFGREPAVWVGVIEAFLAVLLAFGIGITQDAYGPIMGLVVAAGGVIAAWGTKDTLLGYLIAAVKAGAVLLTVYGFALTEQQTGAVVAAVSIGFAFWQRTQTSPVADPVDPSPAQVVPVAAPADLAGEVDLGGANGEVPAEHVTPEAFNVERLETEGK